MPIHLHLDLPTSPTSTLKPYSQSSPPRTLYHSEHLKDSASETKQAFTKSLGKKVSRVTPSIQKLHTPLQVKKVSLPYFAETANSESTSILLVVLKTAFENLTPIDPSSSTSKKYQSNPPTTTLPRTRKEALLQRTIPLHRNASTLCVKIWVSTTLRPLTYNQNKLKQAPNDLDKSQLKKKKGKPLANVVCDYGDDGLTAEKNFSFM